MSPLYRVIIANQRVRELAGIYQSYRAVGRGQEVTTASNRIEQFLRRSPEGGHPIAGDRYRVLIKPLRYTYSINGDEVIVHLIEEASA